MNIATSQLGRGLYAITDGPRADLFDAVDAALRGGAVVVQYRDKSAEHSRRLDEASTLVALCAKYQVPLIVNDDVDLAERSGAAGVHLGRDDADLAIARRCLGKRAIIGVSCYADGRRAEAFSAAGADYLAFGSFYPSQTKPAAAACDVAVLANAARFRLPRVAIGGISPENGAPLIAAGADMLAVISGLFGHADIESAARRYAALFSATN